MTAIQADALRLPIADHTVDLIVTSPPYFGLRSYAGGGIGEEPTPGEYLDALIAATREMVRVLKPSGSIFINLGDKYAGQANGPGSNANTGMAEAKRQSRSLIRGRPTVGAPAKSLIGIPWRYALRCVDELGLILRAEMIWDKPNGLPESVNDRVRRSHEQWFHMVTQPRYYAAIDEIRESYDRFRPGGVGNGSKDIAVARKSVNVDYGGDRPEQNPLGKLPGSVWTVPTEPLRLPPELGVEHYAAFPSEWPRRFILGWSPREICAQCGFLIGSTYDYGMLGVRGAHNRSTYKESRRSEARAQEESLLQEGLLKQVHGSEQGNDNISPEADDSWICGGLQTSESDGAEERLSDGASVGNGRAFGTTARPIGSSSSHQRDQDGQSDRELGITRQDRSRPAAETVAQTVCVSSLQRTDPDVRNSFACPNCSGSEFRQPVIVDVFGGTGTTAAVAQTLGRIGISVDLAHEYGRAATWRANDPGLRAKVLGVDKPAPVTPGQQDLF